MAPTLTGSATKICNAEESKEVKINYCGRLLTFFYKINFFKNFFQEHKNRVSNGLDPDQSQHSVCPDLGPNSLYKRRDNEAI